MKTYLTTAATEGSAELTASTAEFEDRSELMILTVLKN